jgi:hypothetical protein
MRAKPTVTMSAPMNPSEPSSVRKLAYALLITVAAGAAIGRIVGIERVIEPRITTVWPTSRPRPMPTHGDNDRSRWDTVRALVDEGTYVIGRRVDTWSEPAVVSVLGAGNALEAAELAQRAEQSRVRKDVGIIAEDGWKTIDKVLNPQTREFYSSKPPLLSTLVAGLYWLLKHWLGLSITANVWEVVRIILLLGNALPWVIYLLLLSRLAERFGVSDWARLYVVTAACFATLVTPFLTTLNNHTIGTFSALFALYPAVRIWSEGKAAPAYLFFLSGFFAAFTACCELPAAAFTAALGLTLLVRAPGRTLALFAPAAAIPVAAFLVTNYLAIGQLRPAYSEFGGPWYEYEGSHWSNPQQKTGIDFASNVESRAMYAVHALVGHHGWFSLTPMWIFAAVGMVLGLVRARREVPADTNGQEAGAGVPAFLYALTLAVSIVVIGFYLVKSDNYGGWTSGLRWLMWLTPLWLLCMLPVLDRLACCRRGRALGYVLLAISALTASFPAWSPWRHPWLYRLLDWQGWIPY